MTIICIGEKNSRFFVYVYVRLKKMQCGVLPAMREHGFAIGLRAMCLSADAPHENHVLGNNQYR